MKRHIVWILATLMLIGVLSFSPNWAGTFIDDFEDGDLDGWQQIWPVGAALWKVVNGELECSRQGRVSAEIATGKVSWTDYTIEVDAKLLQDHGAGDVDLNPRITKRSADGTGDGYGFMVGDWTGVSEVTVTRLPDFADVKAREPFEPLELDRWHHLKLEAKGSKFTFWINNEKVIEYQDDMYPKGMVSIGLANYTARFDNVIITGPDVPDVTPPTWKGRPVQPRGKQATTWGEIKRR
ncbi:DUF1080 domain-containing protein [Candidatus Poribacteria bacterium]|nr:DUF1080 domain-containing protein [Candidatus Poribacteria bacterium]